VGLNASLADCSVTGTMRLLVYVDNATRVICTSFLSTSIDPNYIDQVIHDDSGNLRRSGLLVHPEKAASSVSVQNNVMRFPGNTDAPATVTPAPVLNIVFYVADYFLLMLVMCSGSLKFVLTV